MNYNELLNLYKNIEIDEKKADSIIKKLLSPLPLEEAEELEKIIPSRFKYTGPGKWAKIIRESQKS